MGNFDCARFVNIPHRHFDDVKLDANAGRHQRPVTLNGLKNATAHRAAANNAQVHLLHRNGEIAEKSTGRQFIFAE